MSQYVFRSVISGTAGSSTNLEELTPALLAMLREELNLPEAATEHDVLQALGPEGRNMIRAAQTKPRLDSTPAPRSSVYSNPPDPYKLALERQEVAVPTDAVPAGYNRLVPPDGYAIALERQRQKGDR